MKMVSPEGLNLEGRVVVVKADVYRGDEENRRFKCTGGFGCLPFLSGKALLGSWEKDGEQGRVSRWDVESVEFEDDEEPAKLDRQGQPEKSSKKA